MPFAIGPQVKAVLFDAYGTLFDVHSAVARHAPTIGPEAARLSEIWRAKQLEYSWVLSLAGRYEPFWRLTEHALDYALARCPSVDRSVGSLLLAAYRALDCYPEVPAVLDGLRAGGLRTGVLSNGDPAMLQAAIASAGLAHRLDAVISVDAVKVYKTSPRAYALASEALQATASGIVFVSSNRWDIAGASAYGLTPVWVNRLGLPDEYPGLEPIAVVTDLSGLVAT